VVEYRWSSMELGPRQASMERPGIMVRVAGSGRGNNPGRIEFRVREGVRL
jgi:hypothetical protein